jgi:hypothetical protein
MGQEFYEVSSCLDYNASTHRLVIPNRANAIRPYRRYRVGANGIRPPDCKINTCHGTEE